MLAAWESYPACVAAGAEDELFGLHAPSTGERERVWVREPGVAGVVQHAHAHRLQLPPQLLLLVNRVDDALRPVEQPGEIYGRRLTLEAVVGELLGVAREPRRLRE